MWVKSAFSGPDSSCVEWVVSAFSAANGNCVEIEHNRPVVLLRDSKETELGRQTIVSYQSDLWRGGRIVRFSAVPKSEVPADLVAVRETRKGEPSDSWFAVRRQGGMLYFDADEVRAYRQGVEENSWVPVRAAR